MERNDYRIITDKVGKTLADKGYKLAKDGLLEYFTNGSRAFSVDYDDSSKLISLKTAVLEEEQGVDFKTLSSWLLEAGSSDADKESIANDFAETVLTALGAKKSASAQIDMPSKKKNAQSVDMESFTARFLAVYPAHKQAYKDNVATYSSFMFDSFFAQYGVGELKNALKQDNKKSVAKIISLLNDAYINGESDVVTVVLYTILTGALLDDEQAAQTAYKHMEKYPYLSKATAMMLSVMSGKSARKKYL